MARSRKPMYIGTGRYVAAIDPRDGEEIWRTRLPHAGSGVVTILIKGVYLYVGHAGHAYAIDKRTGDILWKNSLPRMGYHPVLLAMEGADGSTPPLAVAVSAAEAERRRRAAAASG